MRRATARCASHNLNQNEGLILGRRTIAKYREELRILTSSQRKVLY